VDNGRREPYYTWNVGDPAAGLLVVLVLALFAIGEALEHWLLIVIMLAIPVLLWAFWCFFLRHWIGRTPVDDSSQSGLDPTPWFDESYRERR
jgi:fatty acid desaturase